MPAAKITAAPRIALAKGRRGNRLHQIYIWLPPTRQFVAVFLLFSVFSPPTQPSNFPKFAACFSTPVKLNAEGHAGGSHVLLLLLSFLRQTSVWRTLAQTLGARLQQSGVNLRGIINRAATTRPSVWTLDLLLNVAWRPFCWLTPTGLPFIARYRNSALFRVGVGMLLPCLLAYWPGKW